MPHAGIDITDPESTRYLCRLIDDGHFSVELKWPSVIDVISGSLNIEPRETVRLLEQASIGFEPEPGSNFLVTGVFDAEIEQKKKEAAFERLLVSIDESTLMKNILVLISTAYDFTLALLEFLLLDKDKIPEDLVNNPYLAIVTSDFFIESRAVNSYVKKQIRNLDIDFGNLKLLTGKGWFMDLLTILKSGISVNESRGFLRLLEKGNNVSEVLQISELLRNGTLSAVVINRNMVFKQDFVSEAFARRNGVEQHEKRLRKFYYWLGIANDFVLGVLFLIGSIEFFPHGDEFLGVILFVIGSSQLVARSLIQIAMNVHINSHRKKMNVG